ncbi:MAG: rod shape-determining protein MreD [Gemmatimonadetes bacterium]|nr:rod shape-determining protein MreD [Gemmatimonadota bacterium]
MSAWGAARVASLRGAPDQLSFHSGARFALLLVLFLLGHLLLAPRIAIGAVAPDFYLMALVYSALRWGPLWGSALGFVLGLNVDAMRLDHFGMHALAFTMAGFGLGKMKQSLYLDLPFLDVILLAGAGLFTGLVTALLAYGGSFELFEQRFFYEVPLAALYTAAVGGLLFRAVKD